MSPARPRSKAPVASRRKRALHALYLAQPFLQFVALMAVLFVLGRCSPLSPSTDKGNKMLSASSLAGNHSPSDVQNAENTDIASAMLPVTSSAELSVLSQDEYESQIEINAINAESGGSLTDVQSIFSQRKHGSQRGVRVLVLPLSKSQREEFFSKGSVRLDLGAALSQHMSLEVRRAYFAALRQIPDGDLSAKAVLVMPETESFPDSLSAGPKVQLALFPAEGKGFAQLSLDDQQQKLIASYKDKAVSMALVLQ